MKKKSLPGTDIIICTKNNQDIIGKCIESVKNQTYKNWKCFVADDNSTDKTREILSKEFPFVKIIRIDKNRGPAYNRNIAIEKGNGRYIVTMDSDATLSKTWLEKMILFMEKNKNVGISSGKILYENKKKIINIAGGGMNSVGIVNHFGEGKEKNSKEYNQTKKVFYLCSASMIIRRDILKKIGLFDEIYFYGYEDLDLCWRANSSGFDIIYFPEAESYHEENTTIKKISSEKITFLGNRNRMLTLLKNYATKSLIKYSPLFLAHFVYLIIFKKNKKAVIRAYADVWKRRNYIKTYRKKIK